MNAMVYDKKCPICGKTFVPAPQHVYKVKGVYVCSWGCVCKYEKEKEKKMKRDDFISNACRLGYCNKKQAEEYCEGKETFTEEDYAAVYRMVENRRYKTPGHVLGNGCYTSKSYYLDGGSEGNR